MRKSTTYLTFIACCIIALALLLFIHPLLSAPYYKQILAEKKQLVQKLGLTDLCLFTEARYTRHLSQADHFAAFQDSPMAFEHFPSGSLTLPPVTIHRWEKKRAQRWKLKAERKEIIHRWERGERWEKINVESNVEAKSSKVKAERKEIIHRWERGDRWEKINDEK